MPRNDDQSPVRASNGGYLEQAVVSANKMRARATPRIVFGAGDDAGANRVELDIPRCGERVVVVHDVGSEDPLPEMTAPALSPVDRCRVAPVCFTDRSAQAIGGAGNRNQVDVVRHQAVRPDVDAVAVTPLRGEAK